MQVQLSSVGITNPNNDTITAVNNIAGSWTQAQLVAAMPHTFFFEQNSFGESRLCAARIDGMPFAITALNNNIQYTPVIEDYEVLYPGNISTHPIHRPK